jgi:hypothetical protein
LETVATMFMPAPFVENPPMVPGPAKPESDPRSVFTPVDPIKTKILLRLFNIYNKWSHVITGLREGFDVGINFHQVKLFYFKNHASSRIDPEFISAYMESEQVSGRYSCPYTPSELVALIGPFQTSPIRLTPKPNSSKFQLIQDLFFPRNHPTVQSINAGICSDDFSMAWGTFELTTALILSLPPGCQAATFNISAAYQLTLIRPNQQNFCCLLWKGKVRVDRAVMFVLASSAGVFGCITDMLVDIYSSAGFGPLTKWVDDFFVICLPDYSWMENDFINLTAVIGIPWSMEKLQPLSQVQ